MKSILTAALAFARFIGLQLPFKHIGMLFSFPMLLISSARAQEIPKNSNTIKVTAVTFSQVVNTLLDEGYFIAQLDTVYKTVRTHPRMFQFRTTTYLQVDIRVKDSTAIITGSCGYTEGDFTGNSSFGIFGGKGDVVYKGKQGNIMFESFRKLKRLAELLGSSIQYQIK